MDIKKIVFFTVEELMILAENGQKDLIFGVGYYYENGIRTSVDYAQAAIWYEKAAEKRPHRSGPSPCSALCPGKRSSGKSQEGFSIYGAGCKRK